MDIILFPMIFWFKSNY